MRTIIRNNYTPQLGDYHERLVIDEAQSNTWLFDCDGVYKRINWKVWNEAGDHETDGISQAYVTKEFNRVDDELSIEAATREAEDEALHQEIASYDGKVEEVEKALEKEQEERVAADEAEATARTKAIEQETTERKAADTALDSRVSQNAAAITSLQNAGLYRGTFDTLEDVPTTTKDDKFIYGEIYNNDFVTVRNAEHEGERGVARYRAVIEGETVTYVFETFIDKEINLWEENQPGLIVGAKGELTRTGGDDDAPGYIGVDPETHKGFVIGAGALTFLDGTDPWALHRENYVDLCFDVTTFDHQHNLAYKDVKVKAATATSAGVMSATDKTKVDEYLKLAEMKYQDTDSLGLVSAGWAYAMTNVHEGNPRIHAYEDYVGIFPYDSMFTWNKDGGVGSSGQGYPVAGKTLFPAATTTKAGVMTAADKTKLDSVVTQLEGLEEALNKINNTEGV